jgi:hypothetical protein
MRAARAAPPLPAVGGHPPRPKRKVFASFPQNEAVDDKSIYPDRKALPSVVHVKKKKLDIKVLWSPGTYPTLTAPSIR